MEYLIKFGAKENVEKLQSGDIFMQPMKYYRELEEKYKKKGQGDKYEGKLHMTCPGGIISLEETHQSKVLSCSISYSEYERNLVGCFYNVDEERLKAKNSNDITPDIIDFNDKEKQEFANWGDTALVIYKPQFIKRLEMKLKEYNIKCVTNKVKYYNPKNPDQNCINDYQNYYDSMLFWKDDYFINQNEFRIILSKKSIEGETVINIGDISDISRCYNKEIILN
ncbi:hypothetical protein [Clostridium sp. C2-6-12]|uniref:hypothetical protein n=1 Tax=Clostridium sp. C2-6-12 TaxID=2698832 RepID=UPI0013722169|nr:hypothetical protein [Clostridium sp. C2-6-12]